MTGFLILSAAMALLIGAIWAFGKLLDYEQRKRESKHA
jgi:hypothetical protein